MKIILTVGLFIPLVILIIYYIYIFLKTKDYEKNWVDKVKQVIKDEVP